MPGAPSEQKRRLLRDLLLNAVPLVDGDADWESARMAAELIVTLEVPALTILAVLAQVGARGNILAELRSVDGGNSAEVVCREPPGESLPVNYNWHVVDQAYRKLSGTPARLVIAGSRGLDKIEGTSLTSLGEFLIEWATRPAEGGLQP